MDHHTSPLVTFWWLGGHTPFGPHVLHIANRPRIKVWTTRINTHANMLAVHYGNVLCHFGMNQQGKWREEKRERKMEEGGREQERAAEGERDVEEGREGKGKRGRERGVEGECDRERERQREVGERASWERAFEALYPLWCCNRGFNPIIFI